MNQQDFEQKVLEIANVIHQNYPPKLKGDTEIMEFANAIRDLLEKDAAENNAIRSTRVQGGQVMREEFEKWIEDYCDKYAPPSLPVVWQAAWNAALEKAAKLSEKEDGYILADEIRALKEE